MVLVKRNKFHYFSRFSLVIFVHHHLRNDFRKKFKNNSHAKIVLKKDILWCKYFAKKHRSFLTPTTKYSTMKPTTRKGACVKADFIPFTHKFI